MTRTNRWRRWVHKATSWTTKQSRMSIARNNHPRCISITCTTHFTSREPSSKTCRPRTCSMSSRTLNCSQKITCDNARVATGSRRWSTSPSCSGTISGSTRVLSARVDGKKCRLNEHSAACSIWCIKESHITPHYGPWIRYADLALSEEVYTINWGKYLAAVS